MAELNKKWISGLLPWVDTAFVATKIESFDAYAEAFSKRRLA
ncbi:hypothetical protein [Sinorhizobium psoraleae]|uniref:Uncharacterized protein n=1 Tax=Sinorhizobium psoraleae TaxID=520838 RepID=A0ABT4KQW7_9HYPH|nr:hypothetical protein [Sinorhizobium psoraleae]MCZ4094371.1 hypothetical protein [Sinorhizobium psoraleae]